MVMIPRQKLLELKDDKNCCESLHQHALKKIKALEEKIKFYKSIGYKYKLHTVLFRSLQKNYQSRQAEFIICRSFLGNFG